MEILNSLPKTTVKSSRRVGRGFGSSKGGHTTGRGAKGDKVRGTTKLTFDGTKIKKSWIKRLPFLRGKHRTNKLMTYTVFSLTQIDSRFKDGAKVNPEILKAKNCKILGDGNITKKISFSGVKVSASARAKILSAGGNID